MFLVSVAAVDLVIMVMVAAVDVVVGVVDVIIDGVGVDVATVVCVV